MTYFSFTNKLLIVSYDSVVNVVFTNEVMGVLLFVVDSFDLDSCVEQVIFASAQVSHCGKGLEGLAALDVDGHRQLAHRDRPQMHVVNIDDVCFVLFPDVLLELTSVNVVGCSLHHYIDTAFESGV